MFTLATFDRDGVQVGAALRPRNLRFTTNYPGGFGFATFELAGRRLGRDYADIGYFYRVQVYRGRTLAWDGEIRAIEQRHADRSIGITAFGYGVLAGDDIYGRIWADDRLANWTYIQPDLKASAPGNYVPDAFIHDRSSRIYLAPKIGDYLRISDVAVWRYELPKDGDGTYVSENIVKVVYDRETVFPKGSWKWGWYDRTGGSFVASGTVSSGGTVAGTITPATGCKRIEWTLTSQANQGARRIIWEEDNAIIAFNGNDWAQDRNTVANGFDNSGGAYERTNGTSYTGYTYPDGTSGASLPGDVAVIPFTGAAYRYAGMVGQNFGKVELRLFNAAGSLMPGYPGTVDLYSSPPAFRQAIHTATGLTRASYTLTARCLAEKNASSSDYFIDLDYFEVDYDSFTDLGDKKENDIYAKAENVTIYTTAGTITADTIAQDIVTSKLSVAAIGLASGTALVNSRSTRSLVPAYFDDKQMTCADALEWACSFGDHNDRALGWAVYEDKVLQLEVQPRGTVTYRIHPNDVAEIVVGGNVQEIVLRTYGVYAAPEAATDDAPTWQSRRQTAGTTSANSANRFGSRLRTVPIAVGNTSSKAQVERARNLFLAENDLPKARSAFTLRLPVYDAGGAPVDLWRVRAGSIIQISRLRAQEAEALGGNDLRDSDTAFLVAATEYDAETGTLTITPDGARQDLARYLARIEMLAAGR